MTLPETKGKSMPEDLDDFDPGPLLRHFIKPKLQFRKLKENESEQLNPKESEQLIPKQSVSSP